MVQLEEIIEKYESLPIFERVGYAGPNGDMLIDALTRLYDSQDKAIKTFINISLCVVAADDYFAPEEFDLIKSNIELCVGREIGFDEAKALLKKTKLKGRQDYVNYVKPILKELCEEDESIRDSFIKYCLAICSADGIVCDEEKQWLEDVLD